MQFVIRSKGLPFLFYTGECWSDKDTDANAYPSEQLANATILAHKMNAEAVQLVENTEPAVSDITTAGVGTPGNQQDSGEATESNR